MLLKPRREAMNANVSTDVTLSDALDTDYYRGEEVIIDDVPGWRHPITVEAVYHDGALKLTDKNGAWFRVGADKVNDVVTAVDSRSLDDYVDLEDHIAPNDAPSESERYSDGRIEIEDRGKGDWSLSVTDDGIVRAAKAIPYDGTRAFSTKDTTHSRSSRRRGSQFRLTPETVVDRYVCHSETEFSEQELRVRINEALAQVER